MIDVLIESFTIALPGYRFTSINDRLSASVRAVLNQIILKHLFAKLHLVCAIAEGSDQLVVKLP